MRDDVLISCDRYSELSMHTPVLNLASIRSCFHVKIPVGFCRYSLYSMYDISSKTIREVNFYGRVQKDCVHPWMTIPTDIFDLKSGKHIYRFDFMDTATSDIHSLFISYISQDDNPQTPYVYMSNRGNASDEDNAWKDGAYSDDFYNQISQGIDQVTEYDPLIFGNDTNYNYCSTCTLPTCENCPYKEG